tara:strand:+ start:3938 stop:4264 length:327 start_codon:yes stop_codon:yes gene_type:complete
MAKKIRTPDIPEAPKAEELYRIFLRSIGDNRNECWNGCGQKKGKKVSRSDAEYEWSTYQSVWFCSKCARDKADYYKLEEFRYWKETDGKRGYHRLNQNDEYVLEYPED